MTVRWSDNQKFAHAGVVRCDSEIGDLYADAMLACLGKRVSNAEDAKAQQKILQWQARLDAGWAPDPVSLENQIRVYQAKTQHHPELRLHVLGPGSIWYNVPTDLGDGNSYIACCEVLQRVDRISRFIGEFSISFSNRVSDAL